VRVFVPGGMGNRVAALANGLAVFGRVEMRWEVNGDCPLGWREVFPKGVPGGTFAEAGGGEEVTWIEGRPAMDWRAGAEGAYEVIAAAMGVRECLGAGVGVFGRFHRCPGARWEELVEAAAREERAFLLTDRWRGEIRRGLAARGCVVWAGESEELAEDGLRGVDATRAFLGDWKRLLGCRRIIALDGPSSLLHLARGIGRRICYADAGALQGVCEDADSAGGRRVAEGRISNLSDDFSRV